VGGTLCFTIAVFGIGLLLGLDYTVSRAVGAGHVEEGHGWLVQGVYVALLAALPGMAAFYAWWYPTRWLGWSFWPKYSGFGRLAPHLRFVERASRRLARASFHGMLVYQAKLQNKQAFLFRLVDIANETFAMAASVARAQALLDRRAPEAAEAVRLADVFCLSARRRVSQLFSELWSNDDAVRYRHGIDVLTGRHQWLEGGTVGPDTTAAATPAEAVKEEVPVGA